MHKYQIINLLFLISFPVYGAGAYVAAKLSPSVGYLVSCSIHLLIILFYCIDLAYQREFRVRINFNYVLMMLFLLSSVASLFIALNKGLPDTNLAQMSMRSLLLVIPFHSFLIVRLYNDGEQKHLPPILVLRGLSLLLFINIAGYYGLGLTNETHSIEGRLNFPFLDGFYSGAGLLAILNLMLLYYMPRWWSNVITFPTVLIYFAINLVFFYGINSRLAILIFLSLLTLYALRSLRVRGLYFVSMLMLPILLSSGLLLYEVLQMPVLASVVQRVDVEDVTTFNGRSYLWVDALNWLAYDQRGLLFGNGYRGQYFLDLVPDVIRLWNVREGHNLHLHSTSLEILVNQGIIAFGIFSVLLYRLYVYYKQKHREVNDEGAFFPVLLFLLFILQVDTFVYIDGLGFVLFAWLVANISIDFPAKSKPDKSIYYKAYPNHAKAMEEEKVEWV
jgi:hypothetical protein